MTTPASRSSRSTTTNVDPPAPGFVERAIAFYASLDVRVERVITDNAFAYRKSIAFRAALTQPRHQAEVHPPALPLDQRESRATEPHPRHRMGLRPPVRVERRPRGSLARLARLLQPRQSPPRHRRQHPHRPNQQRSRSVQLGRVARRAGPSRGHCLEERNEQGVLRGGDAVPPTDPDDRTIARVDLHGSSREPVGMQ